MSSWSIACGAGGDRRDTDDLSFYRATIPYNAAYGSPMGRAFKFGVTKRFQGGRAGREWSG